MRVLAACEFSGRVRDAFAARGHDAWSCDLLPAPGRHICGDVREHLEGWDLIIAFPPCTYLCSSGARWWRNRQAEQQAAIEFVRLLWDAPCTRVAIENPIGRLSTVWRRPDQIIQPWMFGHGEVKATCLWLRGLPLLHPTEVVSGRSARIHRMPDSSRRSLIRSLTYPGIAKAMAEQWGCRWQRTSFES